MARLDIKEELVEMVRTVVRPASITLELSIDEAQTLRAMLGTAAIGDSGVMGVFEVLDDGLPFEMYESRGSWSRNPMADKHPIWKSPSSTNVSWD